jgi:hypothetical protein
VLKQFVPFEITEDDPRHDADIEVFVRSQLRPCVIETDLTAAVALFMKRCEGRFVYVATVMDEIVKRAEDHKLSLDELNTELIPEGLNDSYRSFFTRMRLKNPEHYDKVTAQLMKLIVAAQTPLSLSLAESLLLPDVTASELKQSTNELKVSMFPVRDYNGQDCFLPFHKTVIDWLTDENCSSAYDALNDIAHEVSFYVALQKGTSSTRSVCGHMWIPVTGWRRME